MGLFDSITRYTTLDELNESWSTCERCTLRLENGIVCKAIANDTAKVLIVGKSPTRPESVSGRGMMTDPGGIEIRKWFGKLARAWRIKDTELAFSNIVHCPATIRDPNKPGYRIDKTGERIGEAIIPSNVCGRYLEEEIALIRPLTIISIGKIALNYFSRRNKLIPANMDKARKRVWRYRGANFIASVMPIARDDDAKPLIAEDFHFLRKHAFASVDTDTQAEPDILSLPALHKEVDVCQACSLCGNSTIRVFGNGWARSPLMLVGEAPGRRENETGVPFVGDAGKYLVTKVLNKLRIPNDSQVADIRGRFDLKRIYLTNAVKGWPGKGNPTPTSDHILACNPYLRNQIKIVEPKVIVCLGKVATEAVTGIKKSLGSMRNRNWKCLFSDAKVIVTWHPSFAMRKEAEGGDDVDKAKNEMIADLNKALEQIEHVSNTNGEEA